MATVLCSASGSSTSGHGNGLSSGEGLPLAASSSGAGSKFSALLEEDWWTELGKEDRALPTKDVTGDGTPAKPKASSPKRQTTVCFCGNKFIEDASFCRKCGRKRPEVWDLPDASEAVFQPNPRALPKQGAALPDTKPLSSMSLSSSSNEAAFNPFGTTSFQLSSSGSKAVGDTPKPSNDDSLRMSTDRSLDSQATPIKSAASEPQTASVEDAASSDTSYGDFWQKLQMQLKETESEVRRLDKANELIALQTEADVKAEQKAIEDEQSRELQKAIDELKAIESMLPQSVAPPPPPQSTITVASGSNAEPATSAALSPDRAVAAAGSDAKVASPAPAPQSKTVVTFSSEAIAKPENGSAPPPPPPTATTPVKKLGQKLQKHAVTHWAAQRAESVVSAAQVSAAEDAAVRAALAEQRSTSSRGPGRAPAAMLNAESLIQALDRAHGAVHAEQVLFTEVLKQPLSLFDLSPKAEAEALQRGVPGWAFGTLRIAHRLVQEACRLEDWKDAVTTQILAAKREQLEVKRTPVLDLLESLDTLAGRLHDHLPALRVAREALETRGPPGAPGGALVAGLGGREVDLLDEEPEGPPANHFEEPPVILHNRRKPSHDTTPTCCWNACGAAGSKAHHCLAQTLEFTVDALLVLGMRAGVVRAEAYSGENAEAHRHSPWMRVLLSAWQEARRSSNDVNSEFNDERLLSGQKPCSVAGNSIAGKGVRALKSTAEVVNAFPAALPPIETHYWAFRGLGAPMRMMCVYAKANFIDVKYEVKKKANGNWACSEWEHNIADLRNQNPLAQLPYVLNKDTGQVVSQSNAVYLYLGRILGLNGDTETEQLANEQVLFHVYQMWMEVFDLVYPFKQNKDQQDFMRSLETHLNTIVPAHYKKLDKWLEQQGTGFFASWRLCAADFHVWEILDQHEMMASKHAFKPPLNKFPRLHAFHGAVRADARLQPYFDSPDFKLPVNNKMAFFK